MKDKLKDREWLGEQYATMGATAIAETLGVTTRTVHNWLSRHNIPRTGNENRLPESFKKLTRCSDELEEIYRSSGVSGICSKYDVSRTAVYKALNDVNISLTKGVETEVIDTLSDPIKLDNVYRDYGVMGFAKESGINKKTVYNYMYKHGIERDDNTSSLEKSFEKFLKENNIRYIRNNRDIIYGLELDFYLPDYKIAFELNGLYWHSTKFLNKNYHLEKTEEASKQGIRLFHIFEDEWIARRKQWTNKILSVLGMDCSVVIGARSTKIEKVPASSLKRFFEENHIQGFTGGFYAVVLTDKNENIVAAAIYKKDSSNNKNVILNRYATSCRVVGGLSKIMKHSFTEFRDVGFEKVISFADRTLSDGNLYQSTGWFLDSTLPPDYRYHYNGKRVRKQNFRRKNLPNILGENFNPELSELENTHNNGIYRIYDCGLFKFSFSLAS